MSVKTIGVPEYDAGDLGAAVDEVLVETTVFQATNQGVFQGTIFPATLPTLTITKQGNVVTFTPATGQTITATTNGSPPFLQWNVPANVVSDYFVPAENTRKAMSYLNNGTTPSTCTVTFNPTLSGGAIVIVFATTTTVGSTATFNGGTVVFNNSI